MDELAEVRTLLEDIIEFAHHYESSLYGGCQVVCNSCGHSEYTYQFLADKSYKLIYHSEDCPIGKAIEYLSNLK